MFTLPYGEDILYTTYSTPIIYIYTGDVLYPNMAPNTFSTESLRQTVAANSYQLFRQWLRTLPHIEVELEPFSRSHGLGPPTNARDRTSRLQVLTIPVRVPSPPRPDLPKPLVKIEKAWNAYLDSRVAEWKIFFVFNGILVT